MNIGKLTNEQLSNLVLNRLPALSSSTVVGSDIGADCAWIDLGDQMMVISSDPVTAGGMESGTLTVHVSCNDIAACGVKPTGILIDIIAPPSCSEEDISRIVEDASSEAKKIGVDIVGGHTEVSESVNTFIVISTAFGLVGKDHPVPLGHAVEGDSLILTKTCGIEGTYIAAKEHRSKLSSLPSELIDRASSYSSLISVVPEGVVTGALESSSGSLNDRGYKIGAADLLHDVTEGGVLGAAYEMAHISGLGITVDERLIPITDETSRICEVLNINPFRLISSGSLLIATPEPDRILKALSDEGINAVIIGKFTSKNQGFNRVDKATGKTVELTPPEADELYGM